MNELPLTCALCNATLETRYNQETSRIEVFCPSCGGVARSLAFEEALRYGRNAARQQATARLRRIARAAGVPEPMALSVDYEEIERDVMHSVFVGGPGAKYRLVKKGEDDA